MSVYEVNKFCYRLVFDPPFRVQVKANPEKALAGLPLTDEERRLLLAGEVGKLFELGAHSYLLSHISRYEIFGVDTAVYNERMRAAKDPRDG
ncbi:MAG: hypothetical protein RLZ98_700 [Pseudomonadota bacterium]|jgi:hypothetical protein